MTGAPWRRAVGVGVFGAAVLSVGVWWGDRRRGQRDAFYRLQLSRYAGRLERELATAEQIIRDLTDARLYEADQQPDGPEHGEVWAASPPTWRALMEAREQPGVN